jgi:Protein of unknown function (DUF2934)
MKKVALLRKRAERYRQLAKTVSDARAVRAINELATEYEVQAAEMERLSRIRERAHAMWVEQGRPDDLHEAHWRDAEREIAEEMATATASPRAPRKRA